MSSAYWQTLVKCRWVFSSLFLIFFLLTLPVFRIRFDSVFHILRVFIWEWIRLHSICYGFCRWLTKLWVSGFALLSEADLISFLPFHSFGWSAFCSTELSIGSFFIRSSIFARFTWFCLGLNCCHLDWIGLIHYAFRVRVLFFRRLFLIVWFWIAVR